MYLKVVSFSFGFLGASIAFSQGSYSPSQDSLKAEKHIRESYIRKMTKTLASEEFGGRAPGTEGDKKTIALISKEFKKYGLTPAGTQGYLQPVNLVGVTPNHDKPWTIQKDGQSPYTLKSGIDYSAFAGNQTENIDIKNAEIVFVGYGIQAPEFNWNDFKGMKPEDFRGKILLFVNNDPEFSPDLFAGKARLYYGRWTYKFEKAQELGAIGAMVIHTNKPGELVGDAGYGWDTVATMGSGEMLSVPDPEHKGLPLKTWISEEATRKLLSYSGQGTLEDALNKAQSRDFHPISLGSFADISFNNEINPAAKTANVIGVLPGTDLKDEYVLFLAHHDHLGYVKDQITGEDKLHPGAVDNAMGVASVLSVMKAFHSLNVKPRRSIIFMTVSAEEQGLLGSQYFRLNPTIHPGKIVAAINIDMIVSLFGKTKDIILIGHKKSNLAKYAESVAGHYGRIVKPDPNADKGFFYRNDGFNLAKMGIPTAMVEAGEELVQKRVVDGKEIDAKELVQRWTKRSYHQPGDTYNPGWNLEGLMEDVKFLFHLGLNLANTSEKPQWTPGDEFEPICKKMRAEAAASK